MLSRQRRASRQRRLGEPDRLAIRIEISAAIRACSEMAIAIDADNPDRILYAARNRLYVSTNGGVFWRALALELPEIEAVALTA